MAIGLKNKLAPVKEQVQEAYRNGATLRQIAEVHNVSAGTVRNCLVEIGADLRPRGRRKKSTDNVVEGKLLLREPNSTSVEA